MKEKLTLSLDILTVSDTRNLLTDLSGQKIAEIAEHNGISVNERQVVLDDIDEIRAGLSAFDADVIISNGGTGLAKRDVTFEAVQPLIAQEIPGFGEFFRALSFEEIGTHAMASRALAFFNANDQLIFVLPGSTNAVKLAMEKLILPEIYHLIKERRK
jgi:molybdenum cofactor synthesis domain-containing protein